MWCDKCQRETPHDSCEVCGAKTEPSPPQEVFWCDNCKAPYILSVCSTDEKKCPLCGKNVRYLSKDIRPVFPEERLLLEILIAKPFDFADCSVWANGSRYYINGKPKLLSSKVYKNIDLSKIIQNLNNYSEFNLQTYQPVFDKFINNFININKNRLQFIENEAFSFIKEAASKYPVNQLMISFSGGKDSSCVQDLTVRALSNPSIVHVFGDTTLEFPTTYEYIYRFRKNNPRSIFKIAKNKEQVFLDVCEDIGPPSRVMRWCCTMFKTGPITRTINRLYGKGRILTFYGVRKCESASRSKYNRLEESSESKKIQKQSVASPIFFWRDVEVWLYLLANKVDFNRAYRLGYDRVGCWCCPNNNDRAAFLSKIYMSSQSHLWRDFLIKFATRIGKPDPDVYVDTGKWKARQGGNGVNAADDVKIKYTNCTSEENAKVYQINKPLSEAFLNLFVPFGKISKDLGRKLINEVIVLDHKTNIPILSIQAFNQIGYSYAVKIKTMNVKDHENLQHMVSYQIRKFNACRQCLKCESVCKFGAITIIAGVYKIDEKKCTHCKACVTSKYLESGCLMEKFLRTINFEQV